MEKLDILIAVLATTDDPESSNELPDWSTLVSDKAEALMALMVEPEVEEFPEPEFDFNGEAKTFVVDTEELVAKIAGELPDGYGCKVFRIQ